MKKMKTMILVLVVTALAVVSGCASGAAEQNGGADVYIAGFTWIYGSEEFKRPCYWKNGVRINLELGHYRVKDDIWGGNANGIAVSGDDVYVAGSFDYLLEIFLPCYWKNGERINLDVGYAEVNFIRKGTANGIAVSGNDVYAVGYYVQFPVGSTESVFARYCYWKNGERTDLDGEEATGITVSGGDVYIAGYYENDGGEFRDCYWKDGKRTVIGALEGWVDAFTVSTAGGKTDVYVTGNAKSGDRYKPCYWKNRKRTVLSTSGRAMAIVVVDR